ncbi:MAG: T9SS type A sorting domain-containing protein [Bacteroidales bacterium]
MKKLYFIILLILFSLNLSAVNIKINLETALNSFLNNSSAINSNNRTITKLEYFIDSDPGFGNGISIEIIPDSNISKDLLIPMANVGTGFHTLYIRVKDNQNIWSLTQTIPFYKIPGVIDGGNKTITKLEYFVDADPGIGHGIEVLTTNESSISKDFILPLQNITTGFHTLYVRAMDNQYNWSLTLTQSFYRMPALIGSNKVISKLEYFVDTDPGFGYGNSVLTSNDTIISKDIILPLQNINAGFHTLYIRVMDNQNNWSLTHTQSFYRATSLNGSNKAITTIEYFVDTDPGLENGIKVITNNDSSISKDFILPLQNITTGFHTLYIRTKDNENNWSLTHSVPFYKMPALNGTNKTITSLEYFVDTDPGFGSGIDITVVPDSNLSKDFIANLSGLSTGFHTLYIRALDSENHWSLTQTDTFSICIPPQQAIKPVGINQICINSANSTFTIQRVTDITNYSWRINPSTAGTISGNDTIATVDWNDTYSGQVYITAITQNNCTFSLSDSLLISISNVPAAPATPIGLQSVFKGQNNVNYTVSAIPEATSYIWTLPTGATGTSSTNSISVNYGDSAISGDITVSGQNSCAIGDAATLSITVIPYQQNSTFTASVTNAWEDYTNWDHGVPGPLTIATIAASKLAIVNSNNYQCKKLIIQPKGKLTINTDKDLTINDSLILQSDVSGTASLIDNGTLHTITNIVERYIPHTFTDEFHMLASPVANQPISPVFNQTDGFYLWNEATANWIEYSNMPNFATANGGYNFIPGKGYAVSYPANVTKRFIGSLNTGSISIPLTYTAGMFSGWNFIANPYPSAINWNATSGWSRNLLSDAGSGEKAMWIWNPAAANYGAYISNAALGTNNISRTISTAQGFWVKANNAGILSMNNDVREHSDQLFLKSNTSTSDMLRLSVKGTSNSYSDELILKFGNLTDLEGAEKMFSIESTAPAIYSTKQNKNWSINLLTSVADHAVIPIGFKAGVNGNYTISVSDVNSFISPTYTYLKDLKTNTLTDLNQNATYTFTAASTDNTNRFQLLFAATPLTISNASIQLCSIYAYENKIYINSNESIQQINIFNSLGQLVKSIGKTNGKAIISMKEYASAYYIVKVVTEKNAYTEKVFVK